MAATKQNYIIEQGQTLQVPLLVQIPGVATPITGNTTVNNTSIIGVSSTTGLAAGMNITGTGIQVNTIITNISGSTLTISQPATATASGVALSVGAAVGVNLTGASLLFSAKTSLSLADNDPTAVEFNWTETSTPTLGQTIFTLTAVQTSGMLYTGQSNYRGNIVQGYSYQIWLSGAAGLPAMTPVLEGIITITQPVSTRQT